MRTLRALAALLSYPTAELVEAAPEIGEAIDREAVLPANERAALSRLIDELATGDLYDLQERYVRPHRSLSLHLFEHVRRVRPQQAMVDLKRCTSASGASSELPDHLPLFLEFLSEAGPGRVICAAAPRLGRSAGLKRNASPLTSVFSCAQTRRPRQTW
jgi:nitrate reductase delta subunit